MRLERTEDRSGRGPGAAEGGGRQPAVPACSRSALATALAAATIALALPACAGTGGSAAPAQSPQCDNGMLCGDSLDKGKDGQITASEWSGAFRSMDTNGDGVVS